jgi:flagellar hook-associated protein FlgK
MTLSVLQHQLDQVEQQLNEAADLLVSNDAQGLANAGSAIQALSVELMQTLRSHTDAQATSPTVLNRIQHLASGLNALRENLSRRAAYVDQALRVVLPSPPDLTYTGAAKPFGAVSAPAGTRNVLSA